MITLYTFGPMFGMPDPSPFVTKALVLLKMSGLPFKIDADPKALSKSPKGKLPFINDDGKIIAVLEHHPRRSQIRLVNRQPSGA